MRKTVEVVKNKEKEEEEKKEIGREDKERGVEKEKL